MDDNFRCYLVAWTGGYENPSFSFCEDYAQANELFDDWASQMQEGDSLHLLGYSHTTETLRSL